MHPSFDRLNRSELMDAIKSHYHSHHLMRKYAVNQGDKRSKKQLGADFQSIVYGYVTRQGRSGVGRRK